MIDQPGFCKSRSPSLIWAIVALVPALCAADSDLDRKDMERLQGDWAVTAMVYEGTPIAQEEGLALFRSIKADHYEVHKYDRRVGQGTFKIDATKSPRTIDAFPLGASGKPGPAMLGIYEFKGDLLRTCYGKPGKPRPTSFESTAESATVYSEWERESK